MVTEEKCFIALLIFNSRSTPNRVINESFERETTLPIVSENIPVAEQRDSFARDFLSEIFHNFRNFDHSYPILTHHSSWIT